MQRALCAMATSMLLMLAATADAQPTDHARAQQHFRAGRSLVLAGRCREAVEELRVSIEFEPSIGAYLNLGDCHSKMKNLAEAWRAYKQAEALALAQKVTDRADEARAELARIEAATTRLSIRAPADAAGLTVTVDGRTIPNAELAAVVTDPDVDHRVAARADGKEPWQQSVRGGVGKVVTVDIAFQDARAAAAPVPARVETEKSPTEDIAPARSNDGSGMRTAGVVIGGVGIATIAVGGVFGVLALSARNELDDEVKARCHPDCNPDLSTTLDPIESRARDRATVSTILVGAGAAALVTGVVLWVVSPRAPKRESGNASARTWSVGPGPDARSPLGMSVVGTF